MATPAAEDPSTNGRPVLPNADAAKAADVTLLETTMAELRGFYFGGPAADRPPPENFLPALFFPFREPARVRTDYLGHGYFLSNPATCSDVILALRYGRAPGAENGRPLTEVIPNFYILDDNYPQKAAPMPKGAAAP